MEFHADVGSRRIAYILHGSALRELEMSQWLSAVTIFRQCLPAVFLCAFGQASDIRIV